MELFHKAKKEMAFLKMGLYGEAGVGKTFTSSKIAIGLHKHIKAKKPCFFIDTETGSDFVLHLFEEEKIELYVTKTRAFKDLLDAVDIAEKEGSVLILDSITHFWNEMLKAYQKKHDLNRITLRHWIPLKQTWREFTDRYVSSAIHIIMAGRSAFIWDDVEDEEGVKELKKTGTKMKAETEMGYEPSLLVEIVKARPSNKPGSGWVHRAWVVKDRFDVINGKHFDSPGFESFLPHIQNLNLGGKHKAIEAGRTSEDMFEKNDTGYDKHRKAKGLIEEIKNEFILYRPGSDAQSKQDRILLMKDVFGTSAWSNVETMRLEDLESGLKTIKNKNKKKEKKNDGKTT